MNAQTHNARAPKRATNLSINADLLARAKAAGIPLSRTLEEALEAKLKAKEAADWRAENREAIESYNQRIAAEGTFGDEFRSF